MAGFETGEGVAAAVPAIPPFLDGLNERVRRAADAEDRQTKPIKRYRTVFISDVHLGTRGCKAELLADFLKYSSCEKLYLVGDIIDGWRLRKTWYWNRHHDRIIRRVLKKAKSKTDVVYLSGNHDEMLRNWIPFGIEVAGIKFENEVIHVTANGKRLLVTHGDEFDSVVRHARLLATLGDTAYTWALALNHWFNGVRRRLGYPYWSLSAWLKYQVKTAVKYIDKFEETLAEKARRMGLDGVVCGHIHYAQMRMIGDVLYLNDGDWVESCTALVEHFDGRLEIIRHAALTDVAVLADIRSGRVDRAVSPG